MTKANVATLCKDLYKRTYVKYRTSKRQLIKCMMQKKKRKQKVVLIWVDSVPQEESPTADEK